MFYPTLDLLKKIHAYIIESEGGTQGILSESLLESSLDRPLTKIRDFEPYKDIIRKAVALSYSIISWHPFVDGNKRTAIYILDDFLYVNWIYISIPIYMAKYTLSIALDESSKEHMSEEEFYRKILPLCSRNIVAKSIKDLRYRRWTEFRFRISMRLGEFMIRAIDEMEKHQDSYVAKKYITKIHGLLKNREDLIRFFLNIPIDWYGAGDLGIFLLRLRELAERRKQGYPKGDIPFPPEVDSDYIEIKT